MGRLRERTFTGCWKCRKRKIKCDETRPGCRACARIGAECSGYTPRLTWMKTNDYPWKSDGRRILSHAESAWAGVPVIPLDAVDVLIAQCDEPPEDERHDTALLSGRTGEHADFTCNPFNVFRVTERISEADHLVETIPLFDNTSLVVSPRSRILRNLVPTLLPTPEPPKTEGILFNHYVNHVAVIMMPYSHLRNPWVTEWPAAALGEVTTSSRRQALYSAILAQAAFNLANLSNRNNSNALLTVGSQYYHQAVHELRFRLGHDHTAATSTMVMATILTLVFIEAYVGQSQTWRYHLRAASTFLRSDNAERTWMTSAFSQRCFQSLAIIRIIADTSEKQDPERGYQDSVTSCLIRNSMPQWILYPSDFGFTIGAPPEVLDCIARISEFRLAPTSAGAGSDNVLETILSRLNAYRATIPNAGTAGTTSSNDLDIDFNVLDDVCMEDEHMIFMRLPEELAQTNAFLYGTYIYLYRTILHVPPLAVQKYTSKVLEATLVFFEHSNGNFSIWPAFMAAAEAYTQEDRAMAVHWLGRATSFGLGNRLSVKRVLEEIWHRRDSKSAASGLDPGLIPVDWREVMHELNCDVLLV